MFLIKNTLILYTDLTKIKPERVYSFYREIKNISRVYYLFKVGRCNIDYIISYITPYAFINKT